MTAYNQSKTPQRHDSNHYTLSPMLDDQRIAVVRQETTEVIMIGGLIKSKPSTVSNNIKSSVGRSGRGILQQQCFLVSHLME